MTEGRRLLLAVLCRTTVRHVARRCRLTPGAVYHWLADRNGPGPRARVVLERCYGIPVGSWRTYAF